jgi:PAS domain S-box-containing protein
MNGTDLINKEQLLGFMEAMPYMAWYKDKEGKFLFVNQLFAEGCGKTRQEILGKTDLDIWPIELAKAYRADDIKVMETGEKKIIEEIIEDATGGRWFETFKSPVYDDNGEIVGTIGTSKDITVRKSVQNELQNQKRFIRSMIDAIEDLIFFKDLNGVYLGCNKAFATQLLKLSENEIIGKTDFDLVANPAQAQFFSDTDREAIRSGRTLVYENTLDLENGDHAHLETVKTTFSDELGNMNGIIGVSRDITHRKHIEIQLKESELRLNLATESTRIGMWDWQVQTGETVFNQQWADIIGYTLQELNPVNIDTWVKFTHPNDLEKSNKLLQAHFEGKSELYECEVRMQHKDNRWIWVLDRGKVTEWDADHKPVRMLGTHIDIDRQKRTENNLRKQEQILSAVALSIKELITNLNYMDAIQRCFHLIGEATMVDRVYLFINNYDAQGNGFTSQSLEWNSGVEQAQINNPDLQNIPFDDVGSFMQRLKRGDAFVSVVNQMKPEDRTRELLEAQDIRSLIVLPILVREKFWGFIGFDECKFDRIWTKSEFSTLKAFAHAVEKSVERSLMEEELQRAKRYAEAANTLKSQFVANISHEIRTPIHAILGYASLIKENENDERNISYLAAIQKAGDTLMGLLNDILDLSKIEAGKLELQNTYGDISTIVSDVEQVFSLRAAEKKIELKTVIDPIMPNQILIDEVRIRQILFNLVGNAVKFTPKGYIKVEVTVDRYDKSTSQIDFTIKVEDSGIGIPKSQQLQIFEPFKQKEGQSNKHYGGTGLGLSITERLVEIMGGNIELLSEENVGSVFLVHLMGIPYKDNAESQRNDFIRSSEPQPENDITDLADENGSLRFKPIMDRDMFAEINVLKNDIWSICIQNNRVSDIRSFSDQLSHLGNLYRHPETLHFSQNLKSAIDSYDLKKIKEILHQFPQWLSTFNIKE